MNHALRADHDDQPREDSASDRLRRRPGVLSCRRPSSAEYQRDDTDLLAFTAIDRETGSRFTSIEGNRRIGQKLEIAVEARLWNEVDPSDALAAFADEDYVQLELVWHF